MFKMILMRFLESYFRHRWLYLLPVILMVGVGGVYFYITPRKYTAQSVIYVQKQSLLSSLTAINNSGFSWMSPSQITANEIRELMQTDSYVRALIQQTDLEANMKGGMVAVNETIDEVRKAVWVVTSGDNQVIIGANYVDPKLAVELINGTFETYMTWKINTANTDAGVAQNFFTDLNPTYKDNVEAIRKELLDYLTAHPEPVRGSRPDVEQVQVDRIQSELRLAETRYADSLNKLENAKLAASQNERDIRQTYTMVDAPEIPEKPNLSHKSMLIDGLVFVMVGLLVSFALILGAAVLDRTFRFPLDVQQAIHLPVLALVPDKTVKVRRKVFLFRRLKGEEQKVKSNKKDKKKDKTEVFEAGELITEQEILASKQELNV